MTTSSRSLRIPDDVTYDDIEQVLERIVANGSLSAEAVNKLFLEQMRTNIGEKSKAFSSPEIKKELSPERAEELLKILQTRFEAEKNLRRHPGLKWAQVKAKLDANPEKLWSLNEMEITGHQPDVISFDVLTGQFDFVSCAAESLHGNIAYDQAAQEWLEKNYPLEKCNGNAIDLAAAMGVELLDGDDYKNILQALDQFDLKTSCWLKTLVSKRRLGAALCGGRGFNQVCVVELISPRKHLVNRGFRCMLRV